jgi:LPPG:FO 2-phospho-L-lactate transferase
MTGPRQQRKTKGITVLAGGIGGSRFLQGLARVLPPEEITAVVNTGDDEEFHGLHVSPDPDIITYALAGLVDEERGWGLRDDTFRWLEAMARLGHDTWFQIGDRDLATHVHRTLLLRQGRSLSQTIADIASRLGVRVRLLPMSDDRVRTVVLTDSGRLAFQEYLVKRGARDAVRAVEYEGAASARPAPGVLEAIARARDVIVAPSNPVASIGPILAIPGLRDALRQASARKVAVSPIVAGRVFTPPTGEMMEGLGHEVSPAGVARLYGDFLDALLLDEQDAALAEAVRAAGVEPVVTDAVMKGPAEKRGLAQAALAALGC